MPAKHRLRPALRHNALGLRRGAVYNWTAQADSSDSALFNGYDPVVAVYDTATYQYYGKAAGVWKLLWVDTTGALLRGDTAGATPVTLASDGPDEFGTAYGMATQRLAGSVAQGTAFSHEANCLIEYVVTAMPSSDSIRVVLRDATPVVSRNQEWMLYVMPNGTVHLYEWDASDSSIQRATRATIVTAGDRIVVVADGSTIISYCEGVQCWSYSEATAYMTATSGKLYVLGPDSAISDLITWPRRLTGTAAAALEAV